MSKPFPPPPFKSNREAAPSSPFGSPEPIYMEEDPRLKDDDVRFIFKQFLIPEHHANQNILKFILHYCTNRNASQAAKECGLKNGQYWRSRPDIHACIEAITERSIIKYGYDSHEMIERVKEIAVLDPIEFQNPDGTFKTHLSDIRPEARRAIKKFKAKNLFGEDLNGMRVVTGVLLEVELWDKMKSIEMLGSEKNIFKKTTVVQHDATDNMKSILLESGNRAEERLRLMAARGVDEIESSESGKERSGDGVHVGEPGRKGHGD